MQQVLQDSYTLLLIPRSQVEGPFGVFLLLFLLLPFLGAQTGQVPVRRQEPLVLVLLLLFGRGLVGVLVGESLGLVLLVGGHRLGGGELHQLVLAAGRGGSGRRRRWGDSEKTKDA